MKRWLESVGIVFGLSTLCAIILFIFAENPAIQAANDTKSTKVGAAAEETAKKDD